MISQILESQSSDNESQNDLIHEIQRDFQRAYVMVKGHRCFTMVMEFVGLESTSRLLPMLSPNGIAFFLDKILTKQAKDEWRIRYQCKIAFEFYTMVTRLLMWFESERLLVGFGLNYAMDKFILTLQQLMYIGFLPGNGIVVAVKNYRQKTFDFGDAEAFYFGRIDAQSKFDGLVVLVARCCVRAQVYNHGTPNFTLPFFLVQNSRCKIIKHSGTSCCGQGGRDAGYQGKSCPWQLRRNNEIRYPLVERITQYNQY